MRWIGWWAALVLWGCGQSGGGGAIDDAEAVDAAITDAAPDAEVAIDAAPDVAPVDAAADAAADAGPPDRCPGDRPDEALPVDLDAPMEGAVCRNRSVWYRLTVPADQAVSAVLTFDDAAGDLELRLLDVAAPDPPLAISEGSEDVERVAADFAAAPTDYWIEIYGYRGAANAYTLAVRTWPRGDARAAAVSGVVRYEDRPFGPLGFTGEIVPRPAAEVVVQVVRVLDGAPVAEGLTDADGTFALDFEALGGPHVVRALAEVRHAGFVVRTRDRDAGNLYALESAPFEPADAATVDLRAPADAAIGGAFNIVDVARDAFVFIAPHVDRVSPPLTYRWQKGEAFACGSCYSRDTISLGGQLEDPDEYDDVIILHELGHYFVAYFSADDSPGGTHRDLQVSPALAYGEGVAYFFAGLVRGAPHVVDTFLDSVRFIDFEAMTVGGEDLDVLYGTTDDTPRGQQREELVAGLVWDAFDGASAAERFDAVELGEGGVMDVLVRGFGGGNWVDVGAPGIDVADFLNLAACDTSSAAVQALADERAYPFAVADALRCDKGSVPAPYRLMAADGGVWAVGPKGDALPAHRVWSGAPGRFKVRAAPACALPCRIHDADVDAAIVVTVPGADHPGASWLGARRRRMLAGGRVDDGLRVTVSR